MKAALLCLRGAGLGNLPPSKDPKLSLGLSNKTRMGANEGRMEGLNSVNVVSTFLSAAVVNLFYQLQLCHQFNT